MLSLVGINEVDYEWIDCLWLPLSAQCTNVLFLHKVLNPRLSFKSWLHLLGESNISRHLHLVPVFYFCTVIWCLHYHLQHHPLWCFDLPCKTKFTAVRVIGAYFFTLKKLCSEHPVCWVMRCLLIVSLFSWQDYILSQLEGWLSWDTAAIGGKYHCFHASNFWVDHTHPENATFHKLQNHLKI